MIDRKFDDFDNFAENYREIHNKNIKISGSDSDYFTSHKLEIIKNCSKFDNINFLDFGCGDGNTETFFYNFYPNSVYNGIDISSKSIEIAINKKKTSSNFNVFNGEKIPYNDNTFDIILAANVFHHIDFKIHKQLFSEIYRVLKPSGHFFLFEHNPFNPFTRYIVNTCPFDIDAKLLYPIYSQKALKLEDFSSIKTNYILFFPRISFFKFLFKLEKKLYKLPLGAQYYIKCIK